jgi:hypothetical protein
MRHVEGLLLPLLPLQHLLAAAAAAAAAGWSCYCL